MNNGEMQFVFCTECGAKNDINANFCTSCGNKLVKPEPMPALIPVTEESAKEEPTVEENVPEVPETEEHTAEEPAVEEPAAEEEPEEEPIAEVIPVIIPQTEEVKADEPEIEESAVEEPVAETPAVEEPAIIEEYAEEETLAEPEEETKEEETAPKAVPVIIPETEEANAEEPAPVAEEPEEEEKKEETVAPVILPVAPPLSKKEEKLAKKLEEAKKQAQEEARKQAEKEAEKARKAEEKAQKAAAKEAEKARAAEEKAKKADKKADKPASSETVQNNSHYYYNHDQQITETPAAPEKPKKKRRQNFFLKILSFLLALILMASIVIAIPITLLNMFLSDHNIEVIVDRAISGIELDKIEFSTADGTKTLSGALHDITNEFEGWDHITEEQINDALIEDFVKQFVTDALSQFGMSLKEGEAMLGWTPEQIYDFIEANKDTIEKLARDAGYEGKLPIEEKKEMMIENIEKRIGKDGITAATLFGGSEETKQLSRYLDAAQAIFSINILYLAWGLVAFIVILIIFTNLGYFGAFCRTCGFPAFIVGTLYFLVGLGVSPLLSIVSLPIPIFASAIEFTAGFLGALLMDISLIVLAVGLVLIIISFISDAIRRKIDSKKNA